MLSRLVLLGCLFSAQVFAQCSSEDFQKCKSCGALAGVVLQKNPDQGEYYHAAFWNGLYTAYVHDCKGVAETLLKWGANPNLGGIGSSMILSVVGRWPHDDRRINQKWAELLLKYGASIDWKAEDEEKSPIEWIKNGSFEPDYPELLEKF